MFTDVYVLSAYLLNLLLLNFFRYVNQASASFGLLLLIAYSIFDSTAS